jgi:hypothetical protein
MSISADHNKCPKCKVLEILLGRLHKERQLAKIDGDEGKLLQLTKAESLATANLREHLDEDIQIRRWINQLVDLDIELRKLLAEAGVDMTGATARDFNSLLALYIRHIDDKTAWNLPAETQQHSGTPIAKNKIDANGQVDMTTKVSERGRVSSIVWWLTSVPPLSSSRPQVCGNSLAGAGMGSKNTNVVIDELLIELLTNVNGEKIGVFVFDCGPLNRNNSVAHTMQLLVDLGIFETAIAVFFTVNHRCATRHAACVRFCTRALTRTRTTLAVRETRTKSSECRPSSRRRGISIPSIASRG